MCGIVATFGMWGASIRPIFETLLSIDILRGKDSTGVALVDCDNNFAVVKDTVFPLELIRTEKYTKALDRFKHNTRLYLGHNRAATKGMVNKVNAHPYCFNNIIGVHNGTLINDIKDGKQKFDVDSQSIFSAIANHGIEWAWERLDGAATIVWFDLKEKSLNILSNNKRPLFFVFSKRKQNMFIASEEWMLFHVLDRTNVKREKENWKPKENVLLSYVFNEKKKVIEELRAVELKAYVRKFNVVHAMHTNGNTDTLYGQTNENYFQTHLQKRKYNAKFDYGEKNFWDEFLEKKHDICYSCYEELNDNVPYIALDEHNAVCKDCSDTANMYNIRLSASMRI